MMDGEIAAHDWMVSFRKNGMTLAVANIARVRAALARAMGMDDGG